MCYYCLFLFWGGAFRVLWQWLCILPEYKGNSYPTICSMFVATISILSCCAIKQKEPRLIGEALFGIIHLRKQSARSRDRTGTGVTPLVFETNASTNSAIWACQTGHKDTTIIESHTQATKTKHTSPHSRLLQAMP